MINYKKGFVLTVNENHELATKPMKEIKEKYENVPRPWDDFVGEVYVYGDINFLEKEDVKLSDMVFTQKGKVSGYDDPLENAEKLIPEDLQQGTYIYMVNYNHGTRYPGEVAIELYPATEENFDKLNVMEYCGPSIMKKIDKSCMDETIEHDLYSNFKVSHGKVYDGLGGTEENLL